MGDIIQVDFSRAQDRLHRSCAIDPCGDCMLEQVLDTYLSIHPDTPRERARLIITQGLEFQLSLEETLLAEEG